MIGEKVLFMLKRISEKIINKFVSVEEMSHEDKVVLEFGFNIFVSHIMHTLIMLIIGTILGGFLDTVIFILLYSIVRKNAGGVHASTDKMCMIFSVFVMILGILLKNIFAFVPFVYVIVLNLSLSVVICLLAPVDDVNKPVDTININHYRKIVFEIISVYFAMFLIFVKIDTSYCNVITSVLIIEVIDILLGLSRSPRYRKYKGEGE